MGATTVHGPASGHVTNGKTQDVFQTIVKSRKSYKMLKGAAEAVWPPYLEEALLKGMKRPIVQNDWPPLSFGPCRFRKLRAGGLQRDKTPRQISHA
jgi:hypothetical protein